VTCSIYRRNVPRCLLAKTLISLDIYQSYDETAGVLFLLPSAAAITTKLRTTRVLNPSTAIWSTDSRPECGVGIARPSLRLVLVVDSPDTCRLTKSGLNTSNNCNCYKPLPLQNKVYVTAKPVGRPYTSWMATLKNDLARHNLTLEDAIELALNKPLWRLLAASGATHWWCMPNNDDDDTAKLEAKTLLADLAHAKLYYWIVLYVYTKWRKWELQ